MLIGCFYVLICVNILFICANRLFICANRLFICANRLFLTLQRGVGLGKVMGGGGGARGVGGVPHQHVFKGAGEGGEVEAIDAGGLRCVVCLVVVDESTRQGRAGGEGGRGGGRGGGEVVIQHR